MIIKFRTTAGAVNRKLVSLLLALFSLSSTAAGTSGSVHFGKHNERLPASIPDDRDVTLSAAVPPTERSNEKPRGLDFEVAEDEDKTLRLTSDDFLNNFTDPDPSDNLERIKIVSLPENGTLYVYTSKAAIGQEVTPDLFPFIEFEPFPDYAGTTTFAVLPYDGKEYADANWTITLRINQVNDPPMFDLLSAKVLNEDFLANVRIRPEPHYFHAEDDQVIVYSLSPQNSDILEVFFNPANGEISVGSLKDKFGEVEFTITANDGQPENNTYSKKVKIIVKAVNDAPTLAPIGDVETERSSITIDLDVKDPDNYPTASMFTAFSSDYTIVRPEKIKFTSSEDGQIKMTIVHEGKPGDTNITVQMNDGIFFLTQHFRFTVMVITGLDDEVQDDIVIFPNPVWKDFQIKSHRNDEVLSILVSDTEGRKVRLLTLDKAPYQMDVSDIPPGIYIIEVLGNNGTVFSGRIVKR